MAPLPIELRDRVAALVHRPARHVATGWPEVDAALGGGLDADALHEWIGDDGGTGVAPRGVLIALAWRMVALADPAAVRHGAGLVVWIGRWVWPSVRALVGRDGSRDLLARSLWVDPADADARAWAFEQALRCDGVSMAVADGTGFSRALSRRLQLAADRSAVSCAEGVRMRPPALACVARPWRERDALGSASTRWIVAPAGARDDDDSPCWTVRLHRARGQGSAVAASACAGACGGVSAVVHAPWHWTG
jgi:protein ImuA